MHPRDVDACLALLRDGGALERCVVFGSFGLALHGLRPFDGVPDLDVIARVEDVPRLAAALQRVRFTVTSWGERVDAATLGGRYYVRATRPRDGGKGALVVDVTYEGVAHGFDGVCTIDGARVASVAFIEERRALKSAAHAAPPRGERA